MRGRDFGPVEMVYSPLSLISDRAVLGCASPGLYGDGNRVRKFCCRNAQTRDSNDALPKADCEDQNYLSQQDRRI